MVDIPIPILVCRSFRFEEFQFTLPRGPQHRLRFAVFTCGRISMCVCQGNNHVHSFFQIRL